MEDGGSSRPSMGFPLGLAVLTVMLICVSCFFFCFYHWHKLRSLLPLQTYIHQNYSDSPLHTAPCTTQQNPQMEKPIQGLNLTVVMPGDQLPKFLALPTPCQRKS